MIRRATADDIELVRDLSAEFEREVPDELWADEDDVTGHDTILLADDVGIAALERKSERAWLLDLLYVRPQARGRGLGTELLRASADHVRSQGGELLALEVLESNGGARRLYDRLGFRTIERVLAAPVTGLVGEQPMGPTFGSVHAQTDDVGAVERAVAKVLPRLGQSRGTSVTGPRNGWVAVHDELCDRDPEQLKALAKELSYALPAVTLAIGVEQGAVVRYNLYDRGGDVDEYLSVPEFFGELPPGDVVALGSNPTVVARLTGADARLVREVARTAPSPGDLPPAAELVERIAQVMGIAEAGHGWEGHGA
ncbi:MAG TPA: GNAT family N-acetyltransferase [Gaiellaceae bacterium]|nr:GNAT family N-acetyltransferase [Gaiellaceae bacterium]